MAEKGGEIGIGKRPVNRPTTATAGCTVGRNNEYPPDVDTRLFKIRPLGRLRNTVADRQGEEDWRGLTISVEKVCPMQCHASTRTTPATRNDSCWKEGEAHQVRTDCNAFIAAAAAELN